MEPKDQTNNEEPERQTRFRNYGEGKLPHPLALEALQLVGNHARALELGPAPGLRDAKAIVEQFEALDLVDTESTVADKVAALPPETATKIHFDNQSFDQFTYEPGAYDFIHAYNALPFSGPHFDEVMHKLIASLKPGGVLSMTIWTPAHAWNNASNAGRFTFKSKGEIALLLKDFRIHKMELDERVRTIGDKPNVFWSAYEIIAVKIDPENN